jgi:hypothetical protein
VVKDIHAVLPATRQVFGAGAKRSDLEALVASVTGESRGAVMSVPMSPPKEREAYAPGERIFFFRGGSAPSRSRWQAAPPPATPSPKGRGRSRS